MLVDNRIPIKKSLSYEKKCLYTLIPAGFFCPLYSSSPTPCRPEQVCPENSVGPNLCEAGFYCEGENTYPCPPGAYCPEGTSYPIICSAGYYCPIKSPTQIPCPAGTYSDRENLKSRSTQISKNIRACILCEK